ncbi:MAG TPA: PH domain-containing protein [Trebonia sp.]
MTSRTAASPVTAEGRETLRLTTPVVLWWVWMAFVAANVADYAVQGLPSARFGAVISAILLLVTGLAYTLALRPRVIADSSGLTVVNPFRVHHVPWRLIQHVGTGEWVRVQYDHAGEKKLDCWALYVSARAKRKIARGPARPRRGLFTSARTAQWLEGDGAGSGYGRPSSRLPEEARRLASLPVAQALAERLDSRAARERAREAFPGDGASGASARPEEAAGVAASWSWPAIAAAAVPALILMIVAVVA